MTINLQKEGAAIRALLDKADRLEAEADQKTVQAEDCRWQAARRASEVVATGITKKALAESMDISASKVSQLVRVWEEYGTRYMLRDDSAPRYWDAVFMVNDRSLAGRALEQGRSPGTVKQGELKASHTLKQPSSAKAIMADPTVRESARRAIIAAEADEAKTYLMAKATPVDIPISKPGFNWLEADATLSQARHLINSVSRMVKEHGPIDDNHAEMLNDTARQVEIALEILKVVVKAGDLDDAFARMLDGEM